MMFSRRTAARVLSPAGQRRRPVSVTEPLESRTLLTAVTDNFNDNNDTGWSRYAPLEQFGAPGTYDLSAGNYHISAAESPDPDAAGPGRAGAFRNDATFTDFTASVDLVDWDTSLNQAFGILARVSTPGLGSTTGYSLSYSTAGDLDISVVTNEAADDIDPAVNVLLDPSNDYRLVFDGRGSSLVGRLYDLANPAIPIAVTHATDTTYASGRTGVFVYANTRDSSGTADATFDNFSADVAPPASSTVAYWRFEEGQADQEFQYPDTPGGFGSGHAADSAGGEDVLRTFADFTNPVYQADVPAATVPATGAANALSLHFTPNEDLYSEGAPVNAHPFKQFTIEASVKFDNLDGWQTFLGKDGFQFPNSDGNLSSLYFQLANDDANQDHVAFKVHQADGTFIDLYTDEVVVPGQWYNFVAVLSNDGTAGDADDQTVSLYQQDPASGQYLLQDQEDFRGGMANQDRTWTVGRGMYANGAGDWISGSVDEIRISDAALAPANFLFARPTTGAAAVTQVFVGGPQLTGASPTADQQAFRAAAGVDSVFGYPVPAGAGQTRALPWIGGVQTISIRFDRDVAADLQQGDLVLRGSATPTYTFSNFTYDAATHTGTWSLATPVTQEKLRLVLDDAGFTSGFDGEWANASATETYPSGNGSAGGDFDFRINVLGGDATGDGQVNAQDLSFVKQRLNKTAANPGTTGATYSVFGDVTGDSKINAQDLAAVKQRLNRRLPSTDPAAWLGAGLFGDRAVRLNNDLRGLLA